MSSEIQASSAHPFDHSFPTPETSRQIYDQQDLQRATSAFRFFYPTVSAEGIFNGPREAGIEDGKALMLLAATPRHLVFTANSDTPYSSGALDLRAMGPVVIEVPKGPFIGLIDDHHQRWIVDMGIPGADGGRGGKYLLLPPDCDDAVPPGHLVAQSSTYKALIAVRALPQPGTGSAGAIAALRQVKVYPLRDPASVLPYIDVSNTTVDATPLRWEDNIDYWRKLHAVIDDEPGVEEFRAMYGVLAALGIEKGRPFAPDARMHDILERAAKLGLAQMRVEGFASLRSDRMVWPERRWEWIGLIEDDPDFESGDYIDLQARDRWFIQAIVTSPAMFRRKAGVGSIYFLAARDATGAYLDGGAAYKLTVPQPVPAMLFWSVTAYDAKTRSQVVTPQNKAVLGSLADAIEPNADGEVEIYFGPTPPKGHERQWIQTPPYTGVFLYFRIYGPEAAALDGSWKLGDLNRIDS